MSQPRWALDGEMLAYLSDITGYYELYEYDAEAEVNVKPFLDQFTGTDIGGTPIPPLSLSSLSHTHLPALLQVPTGLSANPLTPLSRQPTGSPPPLAVLSVSPLSPTAPRPPSLLPTSPSTTFAFSRPRKSSSSASPPPRQPSSRSSPSLPHSTARSRRRSSSARPLPPSTPLSFLPVPKSPSPSRPSPTLPESGTPSSTPLPPALTRVSPAPSLPSSLAATVGLQEVRDEDSTGSSPSSPLVDSLSSMSTMEGRRGMGSSTGRGSKGTGEL